MNNKTLATMMTAARNGSDMDRCEVSDWAVNTIREWAAKCSSPAAYSRVGAETMLNEENRRITHGRMTLVTYLRVSRAGSRYRLDRKTRRAVWAQCAIKRLA